jgi:D-sedoheptulose 7-phosphate isomerase
MDSKEAAAEIVQFLQQGADLRIKIARDSSQLIVKAAKRISECLQSGGKLLLFGNGGSAANAQHLAAEFVGRFMIERQALAAIALTTDSSILTAVGNDYGFEQVFARQIAALGQPNDLAFGISTSGTSPNVIAGIKEATRKNLTTIALVGDSGSLLGQCADIAIGVDSTSTAQIQEGHVAIGHLICHLVEKDFSAGKAG